MGLRTTLGTAKGELSLAVMDGFYRLWQRVFPIQENERIWKTRTGEEVRIKDMSDKHLRNTIFWMNKCYGHRFMNEKKLPAWPGIETADIFAHDYDVMRREANRRKLKWI